MGDSRFSRYCKSNPRKMVKVRNTGQSKHKTSVGIRVASALVHVSNPSKMVQARGWAGAVGRSIQGCFPLLLFL